MLHPVQRRRYTGAGRRCSRLGWVSPSLYIIIILLLALVVRGDDYRGGSSRLEADKRGRESVFDVYLGVTNDGSDSHGEVTEGTPGEAIEWHTHPRRISLNRATGKAKWLKPTNSVDEVEDEESDEETLNGGERTVSFPPSLATSLIHVIQSEHGREKHGKPKAPQTAETVDRSVLSASEEPVRCYIRLERSDLQQEANSDEEPQSPMMTTFLPPPRHSNIKSTITASTAVLSLFTTNSGYPVAIGFDWAGLTKEEHEDKTPLQAAYRRDSVDTHLHVVKPGEAQATGKDSSLDAKRVVSSAASMEAESDPLLEEQETTKRKPEPKKPAGIFQSLFGGWRIFPLGFLLFQLLKNFTGGDAEPEGGRTEGQGETSGGGGGTATTNSSGGAATTNSSGGTGTDQPHSRGGRQGKSGGAQSKSKS